MRDFVEFVVEALLPGLAVAILLTCMLMVPIYFLERHACYQQTESFESRFGLFEQCQIKHNGEWIQWNSYRGTEERNNG